MKRACTTEQETFGRAILDALSAPVCVIDEVGTILFVNQAWRNFATARGVDLAIVTEDSHYLEACQFAGGPGEVDVHTFAEGIEAVLQGKSCDFSLEYCCHAATERRWFLGKVTPLQQAGLVRAVIVHEDITSSKQATGTHLEHQELLETVLTQAADAIVVCDAQGNQIFANLAARQLAHQNVPEKALINTQLVWGKAYYPDGRPVPLEKWALVKALQGETTVGAEAHMVRPDGSDYEVLLSAAPLRNFRQEIVGAVATFSDITERKQMEEALKESEARLRLALNSGRMGTWSWEIDSNRVIWDDRECELLGLETVVHVTTLEHFFGLIHPQDQERMKNAVTALVAGGDHWQEDFRIVLPDGQTRWLAGHGELNRDAKGRPLRVIGVNFDITERKQAEQALLHERQLLQRIIDTIPVMIAICDPNLQEFRLNREFERVLGWTTAEARQVNLLEKCYPKPEDRTVAIQYMQSLQPGWCDFKVTAKDGSIVDCAWANTRLSDATHIHIGIDVRERRQSEEALRKAHNQLKGILESISDAFVSLNRQWRYTYVNRTATRLLRQSAQELIGRTLWDAFPATLGSAFEQGLRHAMEQQVFVIFEAYYPPFASWFECHCYPSQEGLSVFFSDTTERKRIEQALRENEERLRAIIEAVPDVLLVLDEDGHYLEILTADPHLLYTDPAELRGKLVTEVLPVEVAQRILTAIHQALLSRRTQTLEYELPIARAGKRSYEVSLAPLGVPILGKSAVVTLARDVTQHRLTEANLRQAQKMEAIGQLTGGVAHDFNNLLAIILGNLELLAEELPNQIELQDLIQRSLDAAERGASLIQYLLTFSRRQRSQNKAVNVNELVAGMIDVLRRTLGETVEIKTILAKDVAQTVIDPSQLENALFNLALNARDAMSQGGELTLETANVWLDEDYTVVHRYTRPGRYILLKVSDTGAGMTQEVREHALEPFFTTKEVGQGSGLGLSMVYGLVKQSGGYIELYSEINCGTTVELYLPVVEQKESGDLAEVSTPQNASLPRGQAQTILVVEDNPSVRQSAVHMLQNLGYRTVEAASAKDALDLLEKTPQVAVLFTDMILPGGMSGEDLAMEAQQRLPNLKVLFTSGYTERSMVYTNQFPKGSEFLRKPYRQSQLAIRLHVMLGDG